jgi:sulfite dehydrogenase (quinone) subunit SoeA
LKDNQRFFKFANLDYLEFAVRMGFVPSARQIVIQLYSEPLQKFRLAAEGFGAITPPEHLRPRLKQAFDPLPVWYPPHEEEMVDLEAFPLHALTQRPMIMYHSWGSQNAWLRQILGRNKLYISVEKAAELGVADDDWVRVTSHNGSIKVQARTMEGVNRDTVWTWNAIGKRAGAWALAPDAPEARKGFLLNHLISERLPGGSELSNSDPVTGQAAWFDLRVRVEKCEPGEEISEPQFPQLARPPGLAEGPRSNDYGARFAPHGSNR